LVTVTVIVYVVEELFAVIVHEFATSAETAPVTLIEPVLTTPTLRDATLPDSVHVSAPVDPLVAREAGDKDRPVMVAYPIVRLILLVADVPSELKMVTVTTYTPESEPCAVTTPVPAPSDDTAPVTATPLYVTETNRLLSFTSVHESV
jgi:hypothetical protein